ncbi:hypothetical protein CG91_gp049 [Mycobacterium phage 39HC]|uniref:hypothetical protein n=1 Tax=Mycobacterium phage 39HC TaxID=1463809 RepID=UPI0003F20384|nr:hypothetical protein CG91_gp049 [Mycobacterium phage 39HC]AHJ88349.1 hypothetical protein 39HC_049 [Mycobacterium phage 39HC]AHJ88449.1 hypothetical protein 40BC_049 [Mycobacterium phage 40BC]
MRSLAPQHLVPGYNGPDQGLGWRARPPPHHHRQDTMTDHNQPPRCTCINDDPDHGHTWNPECRIHGTDAHRHPHYRDVAATDSAPEPGTACPHDNHAAHCQCHIGGPILMDIPPAVGQSARQRMTAERDTDMCDDPDHTQACRCHRGEPVIMGVDAENPADPPERPRLKTMVEIPAPPIPTLGDLAEYMRGWASVGVTGESLYYAATKVWPDLAPVTLPEVTRVERERDRLLKEAGEAISGDRERDYGSARDGFARTGQLIAAILDLDVVTAEQVALILAALKISRLAQNTGHRDSWLDLIGYAALGGDIAADTAAETA